MVAAETQVWLEYSVKCGYIDGVIGKVLENKYEIIIRKLITMQNTPEKWTLHPNKSFQKGTMQNVNG